MNMQLLGTAIASLSYSGRNPSWLEYAEGSPAERRAILSRWSEIKFQKGTLNPEGKAAFDNYCRAVTAPDFVPDVQPYRPRIVGEDFAAQERFERGMTPAGDTSEDTGL
jgi:hypothetical protein